MGGVVTEVDRYRGCERLVVECCCGEMLTIDSPVRGSGKDATPSLLCCPQTKSCGGNPLMMESKVSNAVDLLVRQAINKYYAGWLVCEDPGCVGRTRVMPLQFQRAHGQPALHPAAVHHVPAGSQENVGAVR